MQQREGVQLVGGAGRQVAQRVRPVGRAFHRDVARRVTRALRQRQHLEAEAGEVAVRRRRPRDGGLLVTAQRHRQVGRRLRRCNRRMLASQRAHLAYLPTDMMTSHVRDTCDAYL